MLHVVNKYWTCRKWTRNSSTAYILFRSRVLQSPQNSTSWQSLNQSTIFWSGLSGTATARTTDWVKWQHLLQPHVESSVHIRTWYADRSPQCASWSGAHQTSSSVLLDQEQEAQLPQRDRATSYVIKFVLFFTSDGSYKWNANKIWRGWEPPMAHWTDSKGLSAEVQSRLDLCPQRTRSSSFAGYIRPWLRLGWWWRRLHSTDVHGDDLLTEQSRRRAFIGRSNSNWRRWIWADCMGRHHIMSGAHRATSYSDAN